MTEPAADDASRPAPRFLPSPNAWRRRRRADRPRRPSFQLKKALFILPNAFTVSSIFCGFYAIVRATSDEGQAAFYQAGLALFFASFFDAFDGRVARLTRTQSDFGVQIDSLADVVSFGVAPAILVHQWALEGLGLPGLVVSFAFCACGAIRLARFNVLAARGHGSSKHFIGLPIPASAMMIVSLVIAQSVWFGTGVEARVAIAVLVCVLSYLMVSRVRFRTFKDFRPSLRTTPILMAVIIALAVAVAVLKASVTLVCAVSAYILLGLIEEVVFFRSRTQAEREARALAEASTTPAATPASSGPANALEHRSVDGLG
jgi:CDP-diacylglycerol--serine O-phosphatidyltransferase